MLHYFFKQNMLWYEITKWDCMHVYVCLCHKRIKPELLLKCKRLQ